MKKEDKLLDGIGHIEDSLIDEAGNSKHSDMSDSSSMVMDISAKKSHAPLIAAAVIACILIGSSILLIPKLTNKPDNDKNVASQSSKPAPTANPDVTVSPTTKASTTALPSSTPSTDKNLKGDWHRTNIHSSCSSTITISNVTQKGFHINVEAYDGGSTGTLEADASFDTEGNAVAKYTSYSGHVTDINMKFSSDKTSFEVTYDLETCELDFGVGVTMGGEYVKSEPVYTNANILKDSFTEDQLSKIKELIGDTNYNDYFLPYMEVGTVSNGTVSGGLTGKLVYVWLSHMVQENFEIVIGDNGYTYFISDSIGYFSDDPNNSKSAPKHEMKYD